LVEKQAVIQGYAQALFTVAEAEGDLEEVEDELYRFGKTVERQGDLREALSDPALPAERKKALVTELLGDRASRHTMSLIGFVIDQGRGRDLPKIAEALAEVAAERRRRVVAEVRTAVPLDKSRRNRLAAALSKAAGKDVELKVLIDPTVVGGVTARIGDQVFDGTIRRKLELAREQLVRGRLA
jgi:F-type H+-transporting ATPase subunit delta